jgi:predicted RecA/RadA family phage recombinase
MAKNIVFESSGGWLQLELAVAAGIVSGNVVQINDLTGIAITDRDSAGNATVRFPCAYAFETPVTGKNAVPADTAVAIGNKLYKDGTEVNLDASNGKLCGIALGTVVAGATTTIKVAALM